jgi:hypothetical protein
MYRSPFMTFLRQTGTSALLLHLRLGKVEPLMCDPTVGHPAVTLEIVSPVFRGSALTSFKPRASFCQPRLFRYLVLEVTSFPEARISIRPFETPLRSFWRRSTAEMWVRNELMRQIKERE